MALIEGFEITMGGKQFTVPPLNLKGLKKVLPMAQRFSEVQEFGEQMELATSVFQAALARNYPDITVDVIEDLVSYPEAVQMLEAIRRLLEISGLIERGNDLKGSVESLNPTIGDGSTDTLPPVPAGDGAI